MDLKKGQIGICWRVAWDGFEGGNWDWCVAWERVRGDMDGGSGGLPDLFDLHPLLPNDRPALAARHQQVQVQVQLLITIARSPPRLPDIPLLPLLKYLADQCVCLEN